VKTWFAKHPGFQSTSILISSSWLKMALVQLTQERSRRGLCGVRELIHAINEDLDAHNDNPWQRPKVFTT
jgi:hypothetical protein